ncbi:Hypothetical protein PBC10988_13490 [Planctomycetales bacterium 10988]|nr:Hypothetical protein PBC10988_13490 [Planctomycetales bacterium 10988]
MTFTPEGTRPAESRDSASPAAPKLEQLLESRQVLMRLPHLNGSMEETISEPTSVQSLVSFDEEELAIEESLVPAVTPSTSETVRETIDEPAEMIAEEVEAEEAIVEEIPHLEPKLIIEEKPSAKPTTSLVDFDEEETEDPVNEMEEEVSESLIDLPLIPNVELNTEPSEEPAAETEAEEESLVEETLVTHCEKPAEVDMLPVSTTPHISTKGEGVDNNWKSKVTTHLKTVTTTVTKVQVLKRIVPVTKQLAAGAGSGVKKIQWKRDGLLIGGLCAMVAFGILVSLDMMKGPEAEVEPQPEESLVETPFELPPDFDMEAGGNEPVVVFPTSTPPAELDNALEAPSPLLEESKPAAEPAPAPVAENKPPKSEVNQPTETAPVAVAPAEPNNPAGVIPTEAMSANNVQTASLEVPAVEPGVARLKGIIESVTPTREAHYEPYRPGLH